ncbi:unnamed protein product, partial [Amoebophrya sp. A25]|eukprot:GSA25T00018860001.1
MLIVAHHSRKLSDVLMRLVISKLFHVLFLGRERASSTDGTVTCSSGVKLAAATSSSRNSKNAAPPVGEFPFCHYPPQIIISRAGHRVQEQGEDGEEKLEVEENVEGFNGIDNPMWLLHAID